MRLLIVHLSVPVWRAGLHLCCVFNNAAEHNRLTREMREQQRKIDLETFGSTSVQDRGTGVALLIYGWRVFGLKHFLARSPVVPSGQHRKLEGGWPCLRIAPQLRSVAILWGSFIYK